MTEKRKRWVVRMRCVVEKDVFLDPCTEDEAIHTPWEFANDEVEVEQVDWAVISARVEV